MSTSAVVMMVIGVGIVWGSLTASILRAVRVHRRGTGKSGAHRPDA